MFTLFFWIAFVVLQVEVLKEFEDFPVGCGTCDADSAQSIPHAAAGQSKRLPGTLTLLTESGARIPTRTKLR